MTCRSWTAGARCLAGCESHKQTEVDSPSGEPAPSAMPFGNVDNNLLVVPGRNGYHKHVQPAALRLCRLQILPCVELWPGRVPDAET